MRTTSRPSPFLRWICWTVKEKERRGGERGSLNHERVFTSSLHWLNDTNMPLISPFLIADRCAPLHKHMLGSDVPRILSGTSGKKSQPWSLQHYSHRPLLKVRARPKLSRPHLTWMKKDSAGLEAFPVLMKHLADFKHSCSFSSVSQGLLAQTNRAQSLLGVVCLCVTLSLSPLYYPAENWLWRIVSICWGRILGMETRQIKSWRGLSCVWSAGKWNQSLSMQ